MRKVDKSRNSGYNMLLRDVKSQPKTVVRDIKTSCLLEVEKLNGKL